MSNEHSERERTLKLMATDEEWARFSESLPRDWRLRFARLAECVEVDLDTRPERQKETSYAWITIKDHRSPAPESYETAVRRGQLKRSWPLGVKQRSDGGQAVAFSDGLTWGSTGQILGYLLGEVSEKEIDQLYERLVDSFKGTDRGARLRDEAV